MGLIVLSALVLTIVMGVWWARRLGRSRDEGILSGGSVAICGASAALAIAAVLPQTKANERLTLLPVVAVTVLSTIAMIVYPLLIHVLQLPPVAAGVFLGGPFTTWHKWWPQACCWDQMWPTQPPSSNCSESCC